MSQYRRVSMLRSASEPGLPSLLTSPCHSNTIDFESTSPLSASGPRWLSKSFDPRLHMDFELKNSHQKSYMEPLPMKSCLKKGTKETCPSGLEEVTMTARSTRTSASSVVSFSEVQDRFEIDSEAGSDRSSRRSSKREQTTSERAVRRAAMLDDCSVQEDPTSPRARPPPPATMGLSWQEQLHLDARNERRRLFRDVHEHERKKTFQANMQRAHEKSLERDRLVADAKTNAGDSPKYHFEVGDLVTTLGGIEANGPWKNMGHGTVVGAGWQKGFLDVMFKDSEGNKERFAIRAKNLTKVSELHVEKHSPGLSRRYGIRFGDAVTYKLHSKGVVLGEGATSDAAMVKFSGVGVRSVQLVHCLKVALKNVFDETRTYTKKEERMLNRLAAAEWAGVELTEEEGGLKPGGKIPQGEPKAGSSPKGGR